MTYMVKDMKVEIVVIDTIELCGNTRDVEVGFHILLFGRKLNSENIHFEMAFKIWKLKIVFISEKFQNGKFWDMVWTSKTGPKGPKDPIKAQQQMAWIEKILQNSE